MVFRRLFRYRVALCTSLVLASCLCSLPAIAATTFTETFDRPDGAVGGGWYDMVGNVGTSLVISNQQLTNLQPNGNSGIYRDFSYEGAISATATITQTNGITGIGNRFSSTFIFGGGGEINKGYSIYINRSDGSYNNSAFYIYKDSTQLAKIDSIFQFSGSITPTFMLSQSGLITGNIIGGSNSFDFSYQLSDYIPITSGFGFVQEGADGRAPSNVIFPTIDNLSLTANAQISPVIPTDAAAPSNLDLVQMSVNAYSESGSNNVGRFQFTGLSTGSRTSESSIYAEAYVEYGIDGGRPQVVIAIRGSSFEDFLDKNGSFSTGVATPAFQAAADDVASFIYTLRTYASLENAEFTLTGHSLGGAVGQAVAEALHIDATGFDAPGANGLFDANARAALYMKATGGLDATYSSSPELKNIRLYGDDVSKIGNSYGNVQTVVPLKEGVAGKLASRQFIAGSCIITCHDIRLLRDELLGGSTPLDGITDFYQEARLPIAGIVSTLGNIKQFSEDVGLGEFLFFDPNGDGEFIELNMLESDVELAKIYIPSFSDSHEVFAFIDGVWTSLGKFAGFSGFDVPAVSAYRIGNPKALQDDQGNFVLGLQFANAGTFRGSIGIMSGQAAVPEPETWILMILGFGFIGILNRRGLRVAKA